MKLTRTVWVGFLQLDEYGESISVHDAVEWRVSALSEGFLDGALRGEPSVDFELDRYADVMGRARAVLTGTVTRIRQLEFAVASASDTPPLIADSTPAVTSIYSTKEAMGRLQQARQARVVQRGQTSPGFSGFVVDVVLDATSEAPESRRLRIPNVQGTPWPEHE